MDLMKPIRYSDNCKRQLREVLEAHPEALDAEFETLSEYNSIGKILGHMIGAEERWIIGRVLGQPLQGRYEERQSTTLAGLYADWDPIRQGMRTSLSLDLSEAVSFTLPNWGISGTMTKEEIIVHVLFHETAHRGAIFMALQRMGIDPPNFDWPFLQP